MSAYYIAIDEFSKLPIRRLNPAKIEELNDRGLCYNCEEIWSDTHRCRNKCLILFGTDEDEEFPEVMAAVEVPDEDFSHSDTRLDSESPPPTPTKVTTDFITQEIQNFLGTDSSHLNQSSLDFGFNSTLHIIEEEPKFLMPFTETPSSLPSQPPPINPLSPALPPPPSLHPPPNPHSSGVPRHTSPPPIPHPPLPRFEHQWPLKPSPLSISPKSPPPSYPQLSVPQKQESYLLPNASHPSSFDPKSHPTTKFTVSQGYISRNLNRNFAIFIDNKRLNLVEIEEDSERQFGGEPWPEVSLIVNRDLREIIIFVQDSRFQVMEFLFEGVMLCGEPPPEPSARLSQLMKCVSSIETPLISYTPLSEGFEFVLFVDAGSVGLNSKWVRLGDARQMSDGIPKYNVMSWVALMNLFVDAPKFREVVDIFREVLETCLKPKVDFHAVPCLNEVLSWVEARPRDILSDGQQVNLCGEPPPFEVTVFLLSGVGFRGLILANTLSRLSALQILSLRSNGITGSFSFDFGDKTLECEVYLLSAPINVVTDASQFPEESLQPSHEKQMVIGFDCEEVDLCRQRMLYIMQLVFPNAIYIVGGETLVKACKYALYSNYISNVIHSCKRDCEALSFQFGIKSHKVVNAKIANFLIKEQEGHIGCILQIIVLAPLIMWHAMATDGSEFCLCCFYFTLSFTLRTR